LAYDDAKILCSGTDLEIISSCMFLNSIESRGQNFVKWIAKLKERASPIAAFNPENEPKKGEPENIKPDAIDSVDSCIQNEELKDVVDSETSLKVEVQEVIGTQEANEAL